MPEVTDLMRVAQYVKSDRNAPSDVYNAACRMLDQPAPERKPPDNTTPAQVATFDQIHADLSGFVNHPDGPWTAALKVFGGAQ